MNPTPIDLLPSFLRKMELANTTTQSRYIFNVCPMGAVRMTQSDKWKKPNHINPKLRMRECVRRYFEYKDFLKAAAKQMNYELKIELNIVFVMPMPQSWSAKKKQKMDGMPCVVRPDLDNLIKGFQDALAETDDGNVWRYTAEKRYGYEPKIVAIEIMENPYKREVEEFLDPTI
jgi:Holliday junction resolvase RusA-like endonuclease